jgi:hypothetical protein
MPEKNFILKRMWQSKTGLREELYLGYNEDNKLDCITDRNKAKVMTYEECKEWQLILMNRNMWSIERFEEITEEPELVKENVEENTNAENN